MRVTPPTHMSSWEYKVITSGKGGFATPAHLDKFLNELGRDEWEIVEFRTAPDNLLAFTGLARRSTQRDWTLQDAAAAAAKAEAEKLRAEFAAKFQAATSTAPAAEEKSASFLEEKTAPDDGFRKPVDTSRDSDPDAPEEEVAEKGDWEDLDREDELPTFFDALKPHMRRNQRGPGMSVGTDYLAKKWGLAEEDIKGALVECGLQIPADENAKPVYVEFDGDLYWVNINRRGEVWINTREKPRPVFRVVQAAKFTPEATGAEEPKPQAGGEPAEPRPEAVRPVRNERTVAQPEMPSPAESTPAASDAALPAGPELLAKIKPMMRRNRRGPGGSGSSSFLARALRCGEADLVGRFAEMGLTLSPSSNDKPNEVEISGDIWWLNQDSRGGVWINGREKREGETVRPAGAAPAAESGAPVASDATTGLPVATPPVEGVAQAGAASEPPAVASEVAPTAASAATDAGSVLAAIRLLLKETRTGSVAGKVDRVASELGKSPEELTGALVAAGLKVPEKAREKPVFVEHAGEILWFNLNAKGELWVNAKASKFGDKAGEGDSAEGAGGKRPSRRGGRGRGRADKGESTGEQPATDESDAGGEESA